jgi:hypothetical protein
MDDGQYNFMQSLESSGDDRALKILKSSSTYDLYLAKKEEKRIDSRNAFLRAATAHYKSSLGPEEFEALGISIPERYLGKMVNGRYPQKVDGRVNGVMGFLGMVDAQNRIMDKLYKAGKFSSDEYRAAYERRSKLISAGRKDKRLAAILDRNMSSFLTSGPHALNEPNWQHVSDSGRKTHATERLNSTWQKVKHEFIDEGMTPKTVLRVRREYGGIIGENFDEAVRAWSWAYVDSVAQKARKALTSSDNPYGWAPGWSIDSRYGKMMKKWMSDVTAFLFDRKHSLSEAFLEEWDIADKSAGGNLLDDLINPMY